MYYPKEDGATGFKELVFRDSHGNDLTGIGNLFDKDSYVKVIVDANNGYAYLQNAATNGYLNTAILGTYTHDAENLIGSGENGKFKATVSGTISTINVNGVSCSVKCGEESSMDLIAGCWYTFILDGTTVNFSSGGAGASLNFKVVGGTAEPVSPSENMIWVNTEAAITAYVFAATEPSDPVEGMVWISTGTASTAAFNVLKKNGVMVYPMSANQYIDGVWVSKIAKTYQNGAWVDWIVYFYTDGNTFDDITGGYAYGSKTTFEADSIKIYIDTQNQESFACTNNKVDLSGISTLYVEGLINVVNQYGEHTKVYLYATENKITSVADDTGGGATIIKECVASSTSQPGISEEIVLSLDVSSITGGKYIFIAVKNPYKYTYTTLNIKEIRGE